MARIALTTIPATVAGVAATLTQATTDGEIAEVGNNLVLVINNKSAGSTTCTVVTPYTVNGLAVADTAIVVAAGSTGFVALDPQMFKRDAAPDAGKAYVNCSPFVAGVLVGVVQR